MEDKTETCVYEMDVKPKASKDITIEIKQVPIEGKPLVDLDTNKKYLLDAGKEVLQKFRDFTLTPGVRKVDETFLEKNPFEGPIRRTQIPIYPEDIERMRPVHTEETPTLLSTQKLNQHLNGFLQNLPDKETTVKMMHESYFKFIGWTQGKFTTTFFKAKEFVEQIKTEPPKEESSKTE